MSTSSTTTSLQHLKSLLPPKIIIFCFFILNCTRNKLHPLSCQFTSNITPRFPLHASQPTLNYTTLLHYSHIPNTHKKIETSNTRLVHRRPNIRSHSVLLIRTFLSRMSKDGNKERHFLFWRRRINWVKRKLRAAPPNLHRHVHFLRYLREELVFKKTNTWWSSIT